MSYPLEQSIRAARRSRGWSQADLGRRAKVSRAEVSAIETGRVVPSTSVALSLARALRVPVEQLFRLAEDNSPEPDWAWTPERPGRFWVAELNGRHLRFPAEAGLGGALPHDGVVRADGQRLVERPRNPQGPVPEETLVLAGCDPSVGILADRLRLAGVRVLAFTRNSRRALELLRERRVHVAGVHLGEAPEGNRGYVETFLGPSYLLAHGTNWSEGVALARGLGLSSPRAVVEAGLGWVGREEGSGARACLDELLHGRESPRGSDRTAADHRGVVEVIHAGWAEAGICVQIAAEERGLEYLPIRTEAYDLCFSADSEDDPRIQALLSVLRSASYRAVLSELPGYDAGRAGALA